MNIDKIGSIDNIIKAENNSKTNKLNRSSRKDRVSLSQEALQKAELTKLEEIIRKAPDVRMDRVNDCKKKISNEAYINNVLQNNADKIADRIASIIEYKA